MYKQSSPERFVSTNIKTRSRNIEFQMEYQTYSIEYDFSKTFRFNFPLDSLPSDENINRQIYRGILDSESKNFLNSWIDRGAKEFEKFIIEHTPESDEHLVIQTVEGKAKKEEYLRERLQTKWRDTTNHQCNDPRCPHKSLISPLELRIELMSAPDDKIYNFELFEPFKYPIISISDFLLKNITPGILLSLIDTKIANMIRLISHYQLNLMKGNSFKFPWGCWNLIEAVYFPKNLPNSFSVCVNGYPTYTCLPKKKYNFLGLFHQGNYSEVSIQFEALGQIEFCIIGWHIHNYEIFDMVKNASSLISTYETSDMQNIEHKFCNKTNIWTLL